MGVIAIFQWTGAGAPPAQGVTLCKKRKKKRTGIKGEQLEG